MAGHCRGPGQFLTETLLTTANYFFGLTGLPDWLGLGWAPAVLTDLCATVVLPTVAAARQGHDPIRRDEQASPVQITPRHCRGPRAAALTTTCRRMRACGYYPVAVEREDFPRGEGWQSISECE